MVIHKKIIRKFPFIKKEVYTVSLKKDNKGNYIGIAIKFEEFGFFKKLKTKESMYKHFKATSYITYEVALKKDFLSIIIDSKEIGNSSMHYIDLYHYIINDNIIKGQRSLISIPK